jgi:hypothetical protein
MVEPTHTELAGTLTVGIVFTVTVAVALFAAQEPIVSTAL